MRAVSVGMISVECRHTNFNSYTTNLGAQVKLFNHYAFSSFGTPDAPLRNSKVPWNTV